VPRADAIVRRSRVLVTNRSSNYVEDRGIEPLALGLQNLGVWKYADLPTCTESPFFDGEREIESYRVAACRSATGS
jgi:hypothetical protein